MAEHTVEKNDSNENSVVPMTDEDHAKLAERTPEERREIMRMNLLVHKRLAKIMGIPTEMATEGERACKNGHRLYVVKSPSCNYSCDLCCEMVDLFNHPHYMCIECNFDVCVSCLNPLTGEKVYTLSPKVLSPEKRAEYLNSFTMDDLNSVMTISRW